MEVFKGTVIWFKDRIGFIEWYKDDKKQKDMFCHWSAINMEGYKVLKAGQKVEFNIGKNHSGKDIAININVLNE